MPFTLPHCTIYNHLILIFYSAHTKTTIVLHLRKILCWDVTGTGRRYQLRRSSVDLPTAQSPTSTNITTTTSVATAECQPAHKRN